jgi:hypothetical protein
MNHLSVYADNLIAYIARCYSTSSSVLLVGLDTRSGGKASIEAAREQAIKLSVVKGVLSRFGFHPEVHTMHLSTPCSQ